MFVGLACLVWFVMWWSVLWHAVLCCGMQVGAQDVALGIKFSAACTLEIKEYPGGIPQRMCTASGDMNRYFPSPTSSSSTATASTSTPNSPYSSMTSSMSSFDCDELEAASSSGDSVRDISFKLVNGDFQVRREGVKGMALG